LKQRGRRCDHDRGCAPRLVVLVDRHPRLLKAGDVLEGIRASAGAFPAEELHGAARGRPALRVDLVAQRLAELGPNAVKFDFGCCRGFVGRSVHASR
jgi:hypothetical protein